MLNTEIREAETLGSHWREVPSTEGLEDSYNELNPEEEKIIEENPEADHDLGAV
jgi:hypothetical protein